MKISRGEFAIYLHERSVCFFPVIIKNVWLCVVGLLCRCLKPGQMIYLKRDLTISITSVLKSDLYFS